MINYLTLLSFSLSGVYLWSSGIPQISHLLLLMVSFLTLVFAKDIFFKQSFSYLVCFIFYAVFLNFVYFLIIDDVQFISSSVQLVFNFLIFILITTAIYKGFVSFKFISHGIFLGYLIQWCVFLLGVGNYQLAPRYAGTFNDPNQMAYWCLCTFSIFMLIRNRIYGHKWVDIFIFLSFIFFVLLTISRSAYLAVGFFFVSFVFVYYRKLFFLGVSSVLTIVVLSSFMKFAAPDDLDNADPTIVERLTNINYHKQAEERGYTRFFEFPEYMILGSGQGEHSRFNQTKSVSFLNVEMHTTWGGVLFYYGLPGIILVLMFIYTTLRGATSFDQIVLCSTFVYGISTYSFRTPIFWLLLSVFISLKYLEIHRGNDSV